MITAKEASVATKTKLEIWRKEKIEARLAVIEKAVVEATSDGMFYTEVEVEDSILSKIIWRLNELGYNVKTTDDGAKPSFTAVILNWESTGD